MRARQIVIVAAAVVTIASCIASAPADNWRTASRESIGIAPLPVTTPEAVVQVYAARAVSWRGRFGVHTWISTKRAGAEHYDVYEVIGWRLRRGPTSLVVSQRPPDGRWFGAEPELLADLRGERVDEVITRIAAAAEAYPYAGEYRVWPGPNSNTFTAYIAREVPELRLDLPATAIGKDYMGARLLAAAPSGTGWQFSLFGVLGLLAAAEEGVELNLLGLTFGVDPNDRSLKVPLSGRLGAAREVSPSSLDPPPRSPPLATH